MNLYTLLNDNCEVEVFIYLHALFNFIKSTGGDLFLDEERRIPLTSNALINSLTKDMIVWVFEGNNKSVDWIYKIKKHVL